MSTTKPKQSGENLPALVTKVKESKQSLTVTGENSPPAKAEALWVVDTAVLAMIDSSREYRDALEIWFGQHGIDAWKVNAAAVSVDEHIGPRLEVLVTVRDDDGETRLEDKIVPLQSMPPEVGVAVSVTGLSRADEAEVLRHLSAVRALIARLPTRESRGTAIKQVERMVSLDLTDLRTANADGQLVPLPSLAESQRQRVRQATGAIERRTYRSQLRAQR